MNRREINHRAGWLVADYLNDMPCAITKELIDSLMESPSKDEEEMLYASLLAGFTGLEPESSEEDAEIENNYLRKGLKRLETSDFENNPYYQNIHIGGSVCGDWNLSWRKYQPYEAFLRDDLILDEQGREIPSVGYFQSEFCFPSVMQDGREWMSIKPSEIVTSQGAIDAARGKVVTFGLGLGYFVYMALLKPEVESVTVVEINNDVISLFKKYLLPQFPRKSDVRIVNCDAFEYLEKGLDADFVFMDIWHDIADGTDIYIKARQYESRYPDVKFTYWAERSLRCAAADLLFQKVTSLSK